MTCIGILPALAFMSSLSATGLMGDVIEDAPASVSIARKVSHFGSSTMVLAKASPSAQPCESSLWTSGGEVLKSVSGAGLEGRESADDARVMLSDVNASSSAMESMAEIRLALRV